MRQDSLEAAVRLRGDSFAIQTATDDGLLFMAEIDGRLLTPNFGAFRGGEPGEDTYDCWSLTHLATGYSVYKFFSSLEQATRVAQALEGLCDWGSENLFPLKTVVSRKAEVIVKSEILHRRN